MAIFFCLNMPCPYRVITIIFTIKIFYFKDDSFNRFSFDSKFLNVKRTSFIEFWNIFECYFKGCICIFRHCNSYGLSLIVILVIIRRCYFRNVICSGYFIYLPVSRTCHITVFICSCGNPFF